MSTPAASSTTYRTKAAHGMKARVKQIVDTWIQTDVLREAPLRDKRSGRSTKIITLGDNDPLEAEGEEA